MAGLSPPALKGRTASRDEFHGWASLKRRLWNCLTQPPRAFWEESVLGSIKTKFLVMSNRLEVYAAYLLGSHWRQLKHRLSRLRGHKCEGCGSANFIEGHHLIYRDPLESCTEDDVMLLCGGCHGAIHADKAIDRFLKSQSASSVKVRRKIVMGHLERWWGGKEKLSKHRAMMEKGRAKMRMELDSRQPLRECRRPRKRWLDYTPDLVQPKRPWTV